MQYREIVAVTGMSGLYHLMATKSDGAIVRSLQDNSTKFVPARMHNVTPLESIEVYTMNDNVRLHEVFQKMKDSPVAKPDTKAGSADIKKYFAEVMPDMDAGRVYDSDRKKMVKWFEILKGADLLDFSAVNAAASEEGGDVEDEASAAGTAEGNAQITEHEKAGDTTPAQVEGGEAEAPTKKARPKKSAVPAAEGEEEAPKKTARKKKAEGEETTEEKPAKKTAKKKSEE